jgi:hypothetical protein
MDLKEGKMAGRLYYQRMIALSPTPATRATQLAADTMLWTYCLHSLYRQYVNLFGIAPPVPAPGPLP